jgi:TPR repeat protein
MLKKLAIGLVFVVLTVPAMAQDLQKGVVAYEGGEYASAFKELRPLAEKGNAKAQTHLGLMYRYGRGVLQNYGEAVKWYRLAAAQGYARAQNALGNRYRLGQGVPQDETEAAKWYRKAADQGYAGAQYSLGISYEKGQGVPQNQAEAVKWYRKAAAQGHADARNSLGSKSAESPGTVTKAPPRGPLPGRSSANKSSVNVAPPAPKETSAHPSATAEDFRKGMAAYKRGDYAAALGAWGPIAEQGDAVAEYSVGLMYLRGHGVPQDDSEAIKWYRRAAGRGLASAQNNLGLMYEKGRGVPQDDATARKWYRKAAEQGYAHARHNLKLMDKKGRGAAKKAVPATARGGFSVQLGSGKSKAGAVDESVRLTQAHKLALNGLKIVLVRADLGKRGVFYRLRAGPLSDRAAANALCRKLSARKQGCIVIKH